jgi:hypothetical protein
MADWIVWKQVFQLVPWRKGLSTLRADRLCRLALVDGPADRSWTLCLLPVITINVVLFHISVISLPVLEFSALTRAIVIRIFVPN